ncbi:hypothetical protein BDZ97DRAFT_39766 [Flammula alnicola]|nr:hypothetical protein BDZ97DRAFT_39766 [Flammula alnicola]
MEGQPRPLQSPLPTASPEMPSYSPGSIDRQEVTQRYPAIVHAAFISAFLVPIALLPYLAARRHITSLRRKVELLKKDVRRLRNDLDLAISDQRSTSSELRLLQTTVLNASKGSNELRDRFNRREADRIASNESMRADLKKLLDDRQQSRTQAATLRALGMSLADVAAFMQEVELEFGMGTSQPRKDQRGIERLRLLALRMQILSRQQEKHKSS